jgi:hypothetical protein
MLAALLIGIGLQAAAAPTEATGPVSVVQVRMAQGRWLPFRCPPDMLCMRTPYQARFRRVRLIAGAMVPSRFSGQIWLHSYMPRHARERLVVVGRAGLEGFEIDDWTVPHAGVACFPVETLTGLALNSTNEVAQAEQRRQDNGGLAERCFRA